MIMKVFWWMAPGAILGLLLGLAFPLHAQQRTWFPEMNRCLINGHYVDCPKAEATEPITPDPKQYRLTVISQPTSDPTRSNPGAGIVIDVIETNHACLYVTRVTGSHVATTTAIPRTDITCR
jgi:hypothetical protein